MNGEADRATVCEYDKVMATAEAMQRTGGGFVKALGVALMKGDTINRAKIETAFPEYFKQYRKIAKLNNWYEDF